MKERRIIDQFCIEELIDSAQNLNLKDIDYTFSVELKNGKRSWVDIIGKNHDVDENGNKTNCTLCFHDLPDGGMMNSACTNKGGWRDSDLRKWLNEEFFEQLPDWLQKKIVPVVKKTYTDGKIVETIDKIFIPSIIEVFDHSVISIMDFYIDPTEGEGEQYEFFKDWHNRIKGFEEPGDVAYWYWLRSPCLKGDSRFFRIYSDGRCSTYTADTYSGVAPCFAI